MENLDDDTSEHQLKEDKKLREDIIFIEQWKRKRDTTFYTYCLIFFNNGFEQTLTVTTTWLYIIRLMTIENNRIYYAIINAAYLFPTTIFSNVASAYCDKTRNLKRIMILTHVISIIGGLLYCNNTSPSYAIIGNFMSGFSLILRPLMIGDMARSFPVSHLRNKLPLFSSCYSFGMASGPCFIIAFIHLNVSIGHITLSYSNVPGLIRAIMSLISLIFVILYAHDVSKEFDYKKQLVEQKVIPPEEKKGDFLLIRALITPDTLYILTSSFLSNLIQASFFYILPLIVINYLEYHILLINVCYVLPVCTFAMLSVVIYGYADQLQLFKVCLLTWVGAILTGVVLLTIRTTNSYSVNVFLLLLLTNLVEIFGFGGSLYLSLAMANVAQSNHQSYMDSLRQQSRQSATIFGGFIASLCISHLHVLSYGIWCIVILMLIMAYFKRDMLKHPKIVI